MVGVVVDEGDAGGIAEPLKPPPDTGELVQRQEGRGEIRLQRKGDPERCRRVEEIVDSGNLQLQLDSAPIGEAHVGARTSGPQVARGHQEIAALEAKPPDAVAGTRRDAIAPGIGRPDQGPLSTVGILGEGDLERVERSVAFEVIGLDVVDHRDGGLERQECLVVFIRLNHEELITVEQRIAAPQRHPAPGKPGRVLPRGPERHGGHHECRPRERR